VSSTAKAEHDAWLYKRGLHPNQLKAKRTKRTAPEKSYYDARCDIPTSDKVGNGFKRDENKYTGTLIIGIATMHKSNSVPIINQNQAEEIARMRR
jgi:hypothetical protein